MPRSLLLLSFVYTTTVLAPAQSTPHMPPDYRGVLQRASGIFVTPVPGAPFTATVDLVSRHVLPDSQQDVSTTLAHIARDGSGRIYNERRAMVASLPKDQDPPLLSALIYDPTNHLSTFLNPQTHLAHQQTLVREAWKTDPPNLGSHDGGVLTSQADLGNQFIRATQLQGTRKVWTVPATDSGTGQPVTITDEYWYAPALSIYLILKHNDPRTGEQIVAVQQVVAGEPDPATFQVPARFRIVDETPAP
ncbi:hypothetical protein [Acidipila sp. EB88]|uniref:hypothetical protein n=1 Tax=Acidipila sp. EB88 TaxID=2305226 RepID=UPI000F5E23E4|nr:hypothetical protein [Acidipila sp. EB88]